MTQTRQHRRPSTRPRFNSLQLISGMLWADALFLIFFEEELTSVNPQNQIVKMKLPIIFFLVWGVMGSVYFVYDAVQNEERWSRSGWTWVDTFIEGPVIWVGFFLITVCGRFLMLFERD